MRLRKLVMAWVWIATLLFGASNFLFAQEADYVFNNISVKEGLSHATAHHIMQDSRGFIWISTRDGLNRYDGQRFKIFKHEPDDPNSLLANTVWFSHEDGDGLIWIGTSGGGLNIYDPVRDQFHHFMRDESDPHSISSNTVISIFEDNDQTIWIGTEDGGLNKVVSKRYNEAGQLKLRFKRFLPDSSNTKSISNGTVMDIKQDDAGFLWIATYGGGVNRMSINEEEFESGFPIEGTYIMSLVLKDEQLWAATKYHGLSVMSMKTQELIEIFRQNARPENALSSDFVWPLCLDEQDNVWAGTFGGGINKIASQKQKTEATFKISVIRRESFERNTLAGDHISSIFKDRSGIMWAATDQNGVSIFYQNPFYSWPDIEFADSTFSLTNTTFNDFFKDHNKNWWIGTNQGLLFKPKGVQKIKPIPIGDGSKIVNVISQFDKKQVLVGTNTGLFSVSVENPSKIKKIEYPQKYNAPIDRVFDIVYDTGNSIWLSTNAGIWQLNTDLEVINRMLAQHSKNNSLSSNNTGRLYLDSDTLWIGTSTGGLNKLNIQTGKITSFQHTFGASKAISSNKISEILRDRSGNLWIATYGGGLNKLEYQNGEPVFRKFLEKHGLPNNTVKGLEQDESGYLWITTQSGIARFDVADEIILPISIPVTHSNLNLNKLFHYRDSEYIVTGSNGYWLLDVSRVPYQNKSAPLLLTDIKIMGEEFQYGLPYSDLKEITLSHEQNFLSFEFSLLDYRSSDFAHFSYKMKGVDEEWINAGRSHMVHYGALEPGEYTLRAKAVSFDGVPSRNEIALQVTILSPLWQRWWFLLILTVGIALFLGVTYRYRVNSLLQVERTRRHIAEDLHDEISSTLSSITFFASALVKKYPSLYHNRNLKLILESSSEAKEKISDIVWSIDPEHDEWVDLLARCRRFASDMLESKGINYELEIVEDVNAPISLELRKELWLIFKEMVTNAARHSQAGTVHVTITVKENRLKLVVQDDGIGIDYEQITQGNGIRNIRRRADSIGADICLNIDSGEGTKWTLDIDL